MIHDSLHVAQDYGQSQLSWKPGTGERFTVAEKCLAR